MVNRWRQSADPGWPIRPRNPARKSRRCVATPSSPPAVGLSEPGQQRAVLPHPAARSTAAPPPSRRKSRWCTRSSTWPMPSVRHRRHHLRHQQSVVRSQIHLIPMRSIRLLIHIAPAVAKAASSPAWPRARSPTASYADSPAIRIAAAARKAAVRGGQERAGRPQAHRLREGEEERVLRAVQRWSTKAGAPNLRAAHGAGKTYRKIRPAPQAGRAFRRHQSDHESATDCWQTIRVSVRKASRRIRRWKCAAHSLISAMMIHKGDADGMICGMAPPCTCITSTRCCKRAGANVYAAMNPDPAGAPDGDRRRPRQREPERRAGPRSPSWRPMK